MKVKLGSERNFLMCSMLMLRFYRFQGQWVFEIESYCRNTFFSKLIKSMQQQFTETSLVYPFLYALFTYSQSDVPELWPIH